MINKELNVINSAKDCFSLFENKVLQMISLKFSYIIKEKYVSSAEFQKSQLLPHIHTLTACASWTVSVTLSVYPDAEVNHMESSVPRATFRLSLFTKHLLEAKSVVWELVSVIW